MIDPALLGEPKRNLRSNEMYWWAVFSARFAFPETTTPPSLHVSWLQKNKSSRIKFAETEFRTHDLIHDLENMTRFRPLDHRRPTKSQIFDNNKIIS